MTVVGFTPATASVTDEKVQKTEEVAKAEKEKKAKAK